MRRRRVPPEVTCRGGCGRRRRTWTDSWVCRFCLLGEREASPLTFRQHRLARDGRCVVCGGPRTDGGGCEFCPRVFGPSGAA